MAEAAVVTTMQEFKAGLAAQEAAQQVEMARRWLSVERSLEGQIDALAQQLSTMASKGETVNPGKLYRMDRYKTLLTQAQEQTALYARYADGLITNRQTALVTLGVEHAVTAVGLAGPIGMSFNRLSPSAVESMIGIIAGKSGDGGPLGQLLLDRMVKQPGAWERLTGTLVNATAQGWNPRKTARMMRDDLSQGLQKALVISRTEQLRAYRTANVQSYQASGAVRGQMRLSGHDSRVCGACVSDEGTIYPIDDVIPDHPQGRCTGVPIVNGAKIPEWTKGEDWFKIQDEATQRSILGPGKFDAYKEGRFGFAELKQSTKSATWGEGVKVASLKDLGIAKQAASKVVAPIATKAPAVTKVASAAKPTPLTKGRVFTDEVEGRKWINDEYGGWRKGLTAKEDTGIAFYQSPGYELMNGQLRGTAVTAPVKDLARAKDATKGLKAAIAKAPPTTQDMTVFRGFSAEQFELKAGSIVTDQGFVSTAIVKKGTGAVSQYGEQAIASIRLPVGTKVAAGTTRELILAPGSQFRILSAAKKGKTWQVEMELLP